MNTIYKDKLNQLFDVFVKNPNQGLLFEVEQPKYSPVGNWKPVQNMTVDECSVLGDVIGFNPEWVDLDCNEHGLRICCWVGEHWQSAKYCMHHDEYETKPAFNEDETLSKFAPLFICEMPKIPASFIELINIYLKEQDEL